MREFRVSRLFFLRGFRVSRLFFVVACIARYALADIEVEAEYNIETPQQLQVATNTQQLQTGIASNMASVYSAYNGQSDTPASAMVNGEIIVQAPPVPAPPPSSPRPPSPPPPPPSPSSGGGGGSDDVVLVVGLVIGGVGLLAIGAYAWMRTSHGKPPERQSEVIPVKVCPPQDHRGYTPLAPQPGNCPAPPQSQPGYCPVPPQSQHGYYTPPPQSQPGYYQPPPQSQPGYYTPPPQSQPGYYQPQPQSQPNYGQFCPPPPQQQPRNPEEVTFVIPPPLSAHVRFKVPPCMLSARQCRASQAAGK